MPTNKSNSIRVLVVEDEPDLREAMVSYLLAEEFDCAAAGDLAQARAALETSTPEILVLDLGLPDGESLTLIENPALINVGVIITTARSRAEDRLIGAKMGADVYLVKPIQLEELAVVIRNLHRRLIPKPAASAQARWRLKKIHWTLSCPSGASVTLTRSEVLILSELSTAVGVGVARESLIAALGHHPDSYDWRRMEILVRRLRNKCKASLGLDLPVKTVHGFGYAFIEALEVE